MANGRDQWTVAVITLFVIALTTLPYLYAQLVAGNQHHFTGFLLNPLDGHSYLAKMAQGRAGHWRFTLPYTAEAGAGAYLFLFYLWLGRISGALNLSNILTFHAARVLATALMLPALFRFYRLSMPEGAPYRLAFALAAVGSGLGWAAVPFGAFTSDFWVAEAYPFLSAYSNPHFPLGLALLLWILTPVDSGRGRVLNMALMGLLQSIVMPFGVPLVAAILLLVAVRAVLGPGPGSPEGNGGERSLRELFGRLRAHPMIVRLLAALAGGAAVVLYDWWVVQADPNFRAWNGQNVTPAPGPIDLVLSFSPVLLLAAPASAALLRRGSSRAFPLIAWLAVVPLLVYLPFNLQRRMLVGYYVPAAGLAVTALWMLTRSRVAVRRTLYAALVLLSMLTNLLVLLSAGHGAGTREPLLYLERSEADALDWLETNTPADAVILASPEMGLFIPAYSGRRVLYGHPFETVNAETEKQALLDLFDAGSSLQVRRLSEERGVGYLFWGPRERNISRAFSPAFGDPVYQSGAVSIYRVTP